MSLSFEFLIQKLVAKGIQSAAATAPIEEKQPTSIRLKPATRRFVDCQAESLNTSQQAVINMILDGVAEATLNPGGALEQAGITLQTIQERFFELFQVHGVDMPGIVSILKPYGFRMSALSSSKDLLDLLSTQVVHHLADLFSVDADWLKGTSDRIWHFPGADSKVDWYKNDGRACRRILEYCAQGLTPHVCFLRRLGADFEQARKSDDDKEKWREEPIGMMIKLHRTTDDGVKFATYELWRTERWNYWRSRYNIKIIIAFCEAARKNDVRLFYSGYELPDDILEKLYGGKAMLASVIGKRQPPGIWQPNDYVGDQFKGSKESDEWESVQNEYGRENFERLLKEASECRYGKCEA